MKADQATIDAVIDVYNTVTKAHKRAPVEKYIQKQLSAGEEVEMLSGHPRWSSAIKFSGTPDDMVVSFEINPALPEGFVGPLKKMQEEFISRLQNLN